MYVSRSVAFVELDNGDRPGCGGGSIPLLSNLSSMCELQCGASDVLLKLCSQGNLHWRYPRIAIGR